MSRIDVHSHFVPPFWRKACQDANLKRPLPPWDEKSHLEWMDKAGVRKTILSITDPGTHLKVGSDDDARKLSRECNKFAAELKSRHPDRFGYWASLPLPDVEGSLAEISYAFDVLHADGIAMLTNHHGVYLGDPKLKPVFEELDRRGATVFIHPTLPCDHGVGEKPQFDKPSVQSLTAMMEFFFDEARVVVDLLASGTVAQYKKVNFILTHAGGVLPPMVERLIQFSQILSLGGEAFSRESITFALRKRFFYDLSGFVFPDQIHGLLRMVDKTQLLFGSDYPYTPTPVAISLAKTLDDKIKDVFEDEESVALVYSGNAQKLLR